MVSRFTPLAVLSLVAGTLAQTFTINTPLNVVVCRPVQFAWSGGSPPYFLSALPAGQPSAPAIVDFGEVSGNTYSWTANQGVGTSLFLQLRDNTGVTAQSGSFTILEGTDTSCVGKTPASSSGAPAASSGGATGAPAASSTPAATVPTSTGIVKVSTGAASGSGTSRAAASGTASASASAKPSSAATGKYVQSGAVGLAGVAVLAALL